MTILVLILGAKPQDPSLWGTFDNASATVRHHGTLAAGEQFESPDGLLLDNVWVVVPGTDVITRAVTLPPQSGVRARKAAAFALEDDLAVDGEEMHFAISAAFDDRDRTVAAVSLETMKSWRTQVESFGLTATVMVPDYLAVRVSPDQVTVLERAGKAVVRLGAGEGFTIEKCMLAHVLERVPAEQGSLTDVKLLEEVYAALRANVAINLLQGDYALRTDWQAVARPWRRAGIIAGAAAAAALAFVVADGLRLNRHAAAAMTRADAVFRQTMPDVKRVVNPRAQIKSHLNDLKARSSAGFLSTGEMVFAAVADVDGVEIESLRFDAKRGEAAATMSLPSFDAVERVKAGLASRGGIVQEGGARQDNARIIADFTVRLP